MNFRLSDPFSARKRALRTPEAPCTQPWLRFSLPLVAALLAPVPSIGATLAEAVTAALDLAGQSIRVDALRGEADAVRRQASAFVADDPALRLKGVSDRAMTNDGAYELEAMVELPMWLPGQRRARLALAQSLGLRAGGLAHLLRWEVAGTIRDAIWEAELAHVRLQQAATAHQAGQALEAVVAKRATAGELARLDLLTAQQETLALKAELTAAQAEYDQAISRYIQLTGLPLLPDPRNQPASVPKLAAASNDTGSIALPTDHPLLASADAALAGARAERARVVADRRGNPILSIGGKRVRDDRALPSSNALQLEVVIPFGLSSQSAPDIAASERDVTDRLAELHRLRREAERELDAAVLGRRSAAQALAVAEQRAELAANALAVARRAFDLGETDLAARLRAERRAQEANLDRALRRAEQGQALARLNQALGAVPE